MGEHAEIRPARSEDLAGIRACLEASGLDDDELERFLGDFLVAEVHGKIVGTIGMERYGPTGLLRSAAVATAHRSAGLGNRLVSALEERAAAAGIHEMVLLTTTAEGFFARKGYRAVDRSGIRGAVTASRQFSGGCPASAVVMRKALVTV